MFNQSLKAFFLATLLASPASAQGDAKLGKKTFKRCSACHTVKIGKNKTGPTLYNIIGAKAGAVEGFKYSSALLEADLTWDEETLRAFIAKPKAVIPKTKMTYGGLKKEADIDNLIAYLKTKSTQ